MMCDYLCKADTKMGKLDMREGREQTVKLQVMKILGNEQGRNKYMQYIRVCNMQATE